MSGRYEQGGTIEWRPYAEMPEKPHYETSVLLFCPGLTVSGPAVVCHWVGDAWAYSCSDRNERLHSDVEITHYALITDPN